MVYRDDDINYLTNVAEFAAFHEAFVRHKIPHTLAVEGDQMDRNHALNNFIKAGKIFDIQVHGWTHRDYSRCSEDETYRDLVQAVEFITWKFGRRPKYFYPPWNIDSQEARRASARAGLVFDNHRVEARDYLAGGHGRTVNLHYWQDLSLIDAILARETLQYSSPRRAFHEMLWEAETRCLPNGGRVLFVGKTHVYDYDRYFPRCEFVTLDIDPAVRPDVVGDITAPPESLGLFDLVILFGVYEVLAEPDRAVRQAEKLVRPGGWLLTGAPLAPTDYGPGWYQGNPERLSELSLAEVVQVFDRPYTIGLYRA